MLAAIRAHAIPDRDPARARRPQGVEPTAVARRPVLAPARGAWQTARALGLPHAAGERRPGDRGRRHRRASSTDFVAATQRAERLGLDAIELHCAHGYLLHQFLSPVSNRRDDAYGGSRENACACRSRSSTPCAPPGRRQAARRAHLGQRLARGRPGRRRRDRLRACAQGRGCDWIDVSSGGISPLQKIALGPGYQVPFAERIKREAGLATWRSA